MHRRSRISLRSIRAMETSQRPGVENEGAVLAVQEDQVEHIKRVDRPDARNERRFAVTVEGLQGKSAGVDLAAFAHELGQLIVEVQMARERLIAELWEAALYAERHAGTIEQHRGGEAFALKAQRLQHVHQADRTFEGGGVERDQGLLARCGFDVLENLLLVVDQEITLLVSRRG